MSHAPMDERSGAARSENLVTQPRIEHPVFNNTAVLTEGWYPAMRSKKLSRGGTATFKILDQRLVLFRGQDGAVRALDAFCPHMGADLVHGKVEDNSIRCYFHRWRLDPNGRVDDVPCLKSAHPSAKVNSYPVAEKYGLIWVYSGVEAKHEIPVPPGLEGSDISYLVLKHATLFAHHHVMMANGLDLQHFDAVHGIDIKFDFSVEERGVQVFDWILRGEVPQQGGWRARIARWLIGDQFGYRVRIAGGSVSAISYGVDAKFRGSGRALPALHVLWGAVPLLREVSEVYIILVMKKRRGVLGRLQNALLVLATLVLFTIVRDDDIKAFPNMRFNTGSLIPADRSVVKLVQMINQLPISMWTPMDQTKSKPARKERHADSEAHA